MSKAAKTQKPSAQTTTPIVNTISVASTTTVEKKQTVPRTKKPKADTTPTLSTTETVVPVNVAPVTSTVIDTTVIETPVDVVQESSIVELTTEFNAKLQQLGSMLNTIKSDYRALEKKWQKELKVSQKLSSRRNRKSGNRAPSGFVKPTRISDELASFLGKESGTEMARTSVTRDINTYIRANNLQDKENGRKINPDEKLTVLLKLAKDDVLTYFNLQRYMSQHFAKSVKAELAAAAAAKAAGVETSTA